MYGAYELVKHFLQNTVTKDHVKSKSVVTSIFRFKILDFMEKATHFFAFL